MLWVMKGTNESAKRVMRPYFNASSLLYIFIVGVWEELNLQLVLYITT